MFLPGGIGPGAAVVLLPAAAVCCRTLDCNIRGRAVPGIGRPRPQPSAKIPIAGAGRNVPTWQRLQFRLTPGVAAVPALGLPVACNFGRSVDDNGSDCRWPPGGMHFVPGAPGIRLSRDNEDSFRDVSRRFAIR